MSLPASWPDHVVHEDRVHHVLGHADPDSLTFEDEARLQRFHELIARATASGRLRRLVVKDAATQEVLGRGYYRDELHSIAGIRPPRLLVPERGRKPRIQAKR